MAIKLSMLLLPILPSSLSLLLFPHLQPNTSSPNQTDTLRNNFEIKVRNFTHCWMFKLRRFSLYVFGFWDVLSCSYIKRLRLSPPNDVVVRGSFCLFKKALLYHLPHRLKSLNTPSNRLFDSSIQPEESGFGLVSMSVYSLGTDHYVAELL